MLNNNREKRNIEEVESSCKICKKKFNIPVMLQEWRRMAHNTALLWLECSENLLHFFLKTAKQMQKLHGRQSLPRLPGEIVATNSTIAKNFKSVLDFRLTLWYNEDAGIGVSVLVYSPFGHGAGVVAQHLCPCSILRGVIAWN